MRTIRTILLAAAAATPVAALGGMAEEQEAIRSLSGCYKVDFHFVEVAVTDPDYPVRSEEYKESILEWVDLDQDDDETLALQHIMVMPAGVLKHWREEWQYQAADLFDYQGDNIWTTRQPSPEEVNGQWTQRVFSIDDSPRYECSAGWHLNDEERFWQCGTDAPLPRREYTQRADYNVLRRHTRLALNDTGLVQLENNHKIIRRDGADTDVAQERGVNTYMKVDDKKCERAQEWWTKNKEVWHVLQDMWRHIRGHHPTLKFKEKVDGKLLWQRLTELANSTAAQGTFDADKLRQEAHDLIHEYLEVE